MIAGLVTSVALMQSSPEATSAGVESARTRSVALVTAESENALLALSLRSGRVLKTIPGFRAPHIATSLGDGRWVYVTDDRSGELCVVNPRSAQIVARLYVGIGAHHLTVSQDGRRLWIALGERASTIVVVDVAHPGRPQILARFSPSFLVHDLAFGPHGKTVWLTSASSRPLTVVDSRSGRSLFMVPAGAPPQHVAFRGRFAYVTSGYDGTLELVDARSGHVLRTAAVSIGSFNLAVARRRVLISSLLEGTITELSHRLRLRATYHVAPATRDVGLVRW